MRMLRTLSRKAPSTRWFKTETFLSMALPRRLNVTLGSVAMQVWFSRRWISSGSRMLRLVKAYSKMTSSPKNAPRKAPLQMVGTGRNAL